MSLSEGRDTLGEVAEDDQGGVLLSPSEEGTERAGVTAIGFERASGMNEARRTRPALSGEFSKRSFALAMTGSFVFLCSLWISRREAGPFVIFAPPQAGPSCFGVTGTTVAGRLGFGVSSRAPLRNNDKPPFLFFFFDEVGWDGFFSNGEAMPLVLLKVAPSVCLIGSTPHTCFSVDTILSAIMLSEQSRRRGAASN
jgi:hypothetical protein